MRKKGFTLLELLAVIVVLAVIALITIPIILNLTGSSKKKAFETRMFAVEEAAASYYEDIVFEYGEDIFTEGIDGVASLSLDLSSDIDLDKLNIKRNFDKGIVTISSNGDINITAIKDNLCGEKSSKNEIVNMLNINTDLSCFLLDSSSSNLASSEILSAINNLKSSNEELMEKVENLEKSNSALKESVNTISNASTIDKIYPKGSIYISTDLDTVAKVESVLGGKWEVYGDGKVLRSSTNKSGETNESTGSISLTTANIPTHSHSFTPAGSVSSTFTGSAVTSGGNNANPSATFTGSAVNTGYQSANHTHSGTTSAAGGHNHGINPTNGGDFTVGRANSGGGISGIPLGISGWGSYGSAHWFSQSYNTTSVANHTHTFTTGGNNESHYHAVVAAGTVTLSGSHTHSVTAAGSVASSFTGTAGTTGSTGSGTAFSILDPYITVHMYRRTDGPEA